MAGAANVFLEGTLIDALISLTDITGQLRLPVKIDHLRAASYGSNCSISKKI